MSTVPLAATARPSEPSAKVLRRADQVPCVLYGNDTENVSIKCAYNEIYKAYVAAGKSTIVDLDIDAKKVHAIFHALSFDPVSGRITHVDFYAVDMKKEIEATIPLSFEGEAPAVKNLGGILLTPHDQVTVKCLPTVLPHNLPVSLESLVEFGDSLTVADIKVPDGVVIIDETDVMIAMIQEPRAEEVAEVAPAAEEAAVEGTAEGTEEKEGDAGSSDGKKDESK